VSWLRNICSAFVTRHRPERVADDVEVLALELEVNAARARALKSVDDLVETAERALRKVSNGVAK
jgi:hypothetical protein